MLFHILNQYGVTLVAVTMVQLILTLCLVIYSTIHYLSVHKQLKKMDNIINELNGDFEK